MKKTCAVALGAIALSALPLTAGWRVGVNIAVPAPVVVAPAPVVVAPAPAVVIAPDSYVWDGDEYVGVVGGSYYYLGPSDVWLPLTGPRMDRWHHWEHMHGDWRSHTIHNMRYRGEVRHEEHHDVSHDHDHFDHDHDRR